MERTRDPAIKVKSETRSEAKVQTYDFIDNEGYIVVL